VLDQIDPAKAVVAQDPVPILITPLLGLGAVAGIGRREDQRDAVHDAFELIIVRLGQLRNPWCYPGWAHTLARRPALRYVTGPCYLALDQQTVTSPPPDQEIVDRLALGPVLYEAMGQLSD
jgi:hypothetical protein